MSYKDKLRELESLAARWANDKRLEDRETLIIKCLPLCDAVLRKTVASPHRESILTFAYEGLIYAVDHFQSRYGCDFLGYAYRCTMLRVRDGVAKMTYPLRVSHARLRQSYAKWRDENIDTGITVDVDAFIATHLDKHTKNVMKTALLSCVRRFSDMNCADVDHIPSSDDIPDYRNKVAVDVKDVVAWAMESVNPRYRDVINMVYYDYKTMTEVAKQLHISKERVSQIVRAGLKQARSRLVSSGLTESDVF